MPLAQGPSFSAVNSGSRLNGASVAASSRRTRRKLARFQAGGWEQLPATTPAAQGARHRSGVGSKNQLRVT